MGKPIGRHPITLVNPFLGPQSRKTSDILRSFLCLVTLSSTSPSNSQKWSNMTNVSPKLVQGPTIHDFSTQLHTTLTHLLQLITTYSCSSNLIKYVHWSTPYLTHPQVCMSLLGLLYTIMNLYLRISSNNQTITIYSTLLSSNHSEIVFPKSTNTSDCLKDSSMIYRDTTYTPHVKYSY
jgi:hypothetical protein